MAGGSPSLSVITLNTLNTPHKKHILAEYIKKHGPIKVFTKLTLDSRQIQIDFHANSNQESWTGYTNIGKNRFN
jgi:hypothetical protein